MNKLLLAALLAVTAASAASGGAHMNHSKPSKEFERIKALEGEWKGTTEMNGKPETITSSFKLTSAGSAVVETMGAGTPHEMTNVYHDVGGKLVMTHYCALGNAPQLALEKSEGNTLAFKAVKANGIDPKTTPHMNSVQYELESKDRLKASWTNANMPKEHSGTAVFTYTRVK